MKKKIWKQRRIWFIILLIVFYVAVYSTRVQAANVTTSTVRILIGDETNARHHMAISIGEISDEYRYEVKGYEVKSSSYSSSNPEVFSIQNTSEGRCKVEALSQGTGLVTLTIRTKDGKTLKETVFVSVYENILECEGIVGKNAGMYRGACESSSVENDDWKGEFPEGETVFLTAVCDEYFRFLRKEENVESDGYRTGFVKMSDITVPLTSISVEEQLLLDMGEEETLEVETWPEFAPEPDLLFHSNNPAVVTVDSEGNIKTGKAGTAVVTVSTADGAHEAKCTVYVDIPSGASWEDSAQGGEDVSGTEESGAKENSMTLSRETTGFIIIPTRLSPESICLLRISLMTM